MGNPKMSVQLSQWAVVNWGTQTKSDSFEGKGSAGTGGGGQLHEMATKNIEGVSNRTGCSSKNAS